MHLGNILTLSFSILKRSKHACKSPSQAGKWNMTLSHRRDRILYSAALGGDRPLHATSCIRGALEGRHAHRSAALVALGLDEDLIQVVDVCVVQIRQLLGLQEDSARHRLWSACDCSHPHCLSEEAPQGIVSGCLNDLWLRTVNAF